MFYSRRAELRLNRDPGISRIYLSRTRNEAVRGIHNYWLLLWLLFLISFSLQSRKTIVMNVFRTNRHCKLVRYPICFFQQTKRHWEPTFLQIKPFQFASPFPRCFKINLQKFYTLFYYHNKLRIASTHEWFIWMVLSSRIDGILLQNGTHIGCSK